MSDSAYTGVNRQQDFASDFNGHAALINQMVNKVPGATLVQVLSVTNSGGLSMVGTVSVQPMVNQIDGAGNATPHGEIYNIPYFRLQGGTNAVIIDPVVGDIGMAVIASRDLSSVKATRKVSNPGSRRKNSWADGLYVGGFLNGLPTQYIQFSSAGVSIVSPVQISATVGGMGVVVTSAGTRIDGKMFLPHEHSGVEMGSDSSGPVI